MAAFVLIALSRPLRYENGNDSLEKTAAEYIWLRLCYCLNNEKNVRVYEGCIKKIRSLACDDDEVAFFNWWSSFWNSVTFKVPDVAADYIEDFFIDAIDRKQTSMLGLLNVSRLECIEEERVFNTIIFLDTLSQTSRDVSCSTKRCNQCSV